jgi:hypothetical protein
MKIPLEKRNLPKGTITKLSAMILKKLKDNKNKTKENTLTPNNPTKNE